MHDLDPVFIAGRQTIQSYDIFRIVVPNHHQVANLPIGILRQTHKDLHIDTLIASIRHKIDFFRIVFADEHIVPPGASIQKTRWFPMRRQAFSDYSPRANI